MALAALAGAFACLLVSYLRLARSERGTLGSADRWLVALPLGLFLGWLTAANAVSLDSEIVRLGLLSAGGTGEALLGGALLLLGGMLAAALVVAGKAGPPHGYLAYAAAVLWALVGIVVQQHDASLVTTAAALLAAALVVAALLGPYDPRGAGESAGPPAA